MTAEFVSDLARAWKRRYPIFAAATDDEAAWAELGKQIRAAWDDDMLHRQVEDWIGALKARAEYLERKARLGPPTLPDP